MAVQARHLPHDFPFPPVMCASSLFSDEYAACCAPTTAPAAGVADTTVLSDFPASDLTGNYGFLPRKRARVAALPEPGGFFVDQRVPAQGLMPLPVTPGNVQSRVGSGAASTSGRVAVHGATLPSYHDEGDEIDALIRLERLRHAVCFA
nr:unnamed protein product [Digitaria exilis]